MSKLPIKSFNIKVRDNYTFYINWQKPSNEIKNIVMQTISMGQFLVNTSENQRNFVKFDYVKHYSLTDATTISLDNKVGIKKSIRILIRDINEVSIEYEDGTIQSFTDFLQLISMTYESNFNMDLSTYSEEIIDMEDYTVYITKYYRKPQITRKPSYFYNHTTSKNSINKPNLKPGEFLAVGIYIEDKELSIDDDIQV